MTAQHRTPQALSARFARASRPESRIDIPRHEWTRDMDHTNQRIDRLLRRGSSRGGTSTAGTTNQARDYLTIHG